MTLATTFGTTRPRPPRVASAYLGGFAGLSPALVTAH